MKVYFATDSVYVLGDTRDKDWQSILRKACTTKFEAMCVRAIEEHCTASKAIKGKLLEAEWDRFCTGGYDPEQLCQPHMLKDIKDLIAVASQARPKGVKGAKGAKGSDKSVAAAVEAVPAAVEAAEAPQPSTAAATGKGRGRKGKANKK